MITRFARFTKDMRKDLPFAYTWAFLLICAAFVVRMLAGPIFNGFPFLTFFPAVVLAAFICGKGPSIIVSVVGGAMAGFFLMEQNSGGAITATTAIVAYSFYFATTFLIIFLVDALLKALDREAAALEELQLDRNRHSP